MSRVAKTANPEVPAAPRGMRDLLAEEYFAYQGLIEKAAEIALYYGFSPVETPLLEKTDLFVRAAGPASDIVEKEMYTLKTKGGDKLALRPEGTAPVLRAYFENGLQSKPQPVMLYYAGPFFRHDRPQRGRARQFWQFGLETIGTAKSIADALTIKISQLILTEAGLKNLKLEINTIGDKNCRPHWRRDLVNYYKKRGREICNDCRERLKHNPLRLLDCKNPECQPLKEAAPAPLGYLCASCKNHFREVLEYLEQMGLTYEINNNLVRGLDYYSRTVFEISEGPASPEAGLALAAGGRYDYLALSLGFKKEMPAVGVALGLDRILMTQGVTRLRPRLVKKPKIFFVQLSFDAKLKSIEVIEILRQSRIPVAQSLVKDSLAAQLAVAEKMQIPHTLILGQKEALENTVIVRNMDDHSQEVVPIKKLAEYLKKIK